MKSPLPLEPLLNSAANTTITRTSPLNYRGVEGVRFELNSANSDPETYDVLQVSSPAHRSSGIILEITGWEPNLRDVRWAQRLAQLSAHDVFLLFNVPNQPYRGLQEDALLAESIVSFMSSGDPADLTHTKMVGAALAITDHFSRSTVLTGASKRGWTSWLAGFGSNPLIKGIAPRVFDHFDFRLQLARQRELWGRSSPMIEDYNDADLVSPVDDPTFDPVLDLLDPVRSWHGLDVPALAIAGTNDPFWTPDAWHLVAGSRPDGVE
ncbi:MAG: hypothetical protein KF812_10715, partial [Fimbriimonadaceae bacterium]|nr:hypothetical protein [Fimbriimonadaceae bacterium]